MNLFLLRPRRVQSDLTHTVLPKVEEDPCMMDNIAEKLFPQLSLDNQKPSTSANASLSCVSVQGEGDKSVSLPSINVEQNYSAMLSQIVAHMWQSCSKAITSGLGGALVACWVAIAILWPWQQREVLVVQWSKCVDAYSSMCEPTGEWLYCNQPNINVQYPCVQYNLEGYWHEDIIAWQKVKHSFA